MDEAFDVAIVGAGPAGLSAACRLAEKGVKTIVLERGEYSGAKNISGGVLYGHDLARVLPDYEKRETGHYSQHRCRTCGSFCDSRKTFL